MTTEDERREEDDANAAKEDPSTQDMEAYVEALNRFVHQVADMEWPEQFQLDNDEKFCFSVFRTFWRQRRPNVSKEGGADAFTCALRDRMLKKHAVSCRKNLGACSEMMRCRSTLTPRTISRTRTTLMKRRNSVNNDSKTSGNEWAITDECPWQRREFHRRSATVVVVLCKRNHGGFQARCSASTCNQVGQPAASIDRRLPFCRNPRRRRTTGGVRRTVL